MSSRAQASSTRLQGPSSWRLQGASSARLQGASSARLMSYLVTSWMARARWSTFPVVTPAIEIRPSLVM